MKNYDHKKIELKWQKEWNKKGIYRAENSFRKKKFYSLIEFPYPSGDGLHVGHPRPYIGMDLISRKRRMEGFNVLYPIGWDAFGLPTENYAIKTGIHPKIVTKKNTDNFRRQIKMLGISFDWSREINTTDPTYYKWTQWIFLQFLKKGLAYKAESEINWCPGCKIGLANEEVIDGKCERCGNLTEKRMKKQWMLKITKYADRLDKDLDLVDYPERVKLSQRNWIGRSEGSEIEFKIKFSPNTFVQVLGSPRFARPDHSQKHTGDLFVKVFTTRADTLFGATYVVLAPEHPLVESLKLKVESEKDKKEIEEYLRKTKNKSEIERVENKEKTGVELKGIKAINPANNEEIPVWIADYVLPHYGTGAVMAVPAHDERDFEFAKKYNLPIKQVVESIRISNSGPDAIHEDEPIKIYKEAIFAIVKHWSLDKYLCIKWKNAHWQNFITGGIEKDESIIEAAKREVIEESGYINIKNIKVLNQAVHSRFYHEIKGWNQQAHFNSVYIELGGEEQNELSQTEKDLHDLVWLDKKEIENFINVSNAKYAWRLFQGLESLCFTDDGILVNSGEYSGLLSMEARKEITKAISGKMVTKFKLRDWVFSRQRYWGEPIPVVDCERCGLVPVKEKDLPVKLPEVKSYKLTETGESPLANITKWVNTKCPVCAGKAKRETDTMPNWAGSSWYYLRYTDPKNKKEFASKKNLKYWTSVDWYNGGMEHTTLHLLYSRFWHKFLYDLKIVPTKEPYKKRTSHGMILGAGGVKMSKSLGNVVNPDEIVKTYGADTLRIYEMFMGPFEDTAVWNTESIIGSRRFIEKVWRIGQKISENLNNFSGPRVVHSKFSKESRLNQTMKNHSSSLSLEKLLHKTIKKVSEDIENMNFNTAISSMMIFANEVEKKDFQLSIFNFQLFLKILAPFAPHVTEELWRTLGEKNSVHFSEWPKYDTKLIKDEEVKIVIQVNGKVRSEILVKKDEEEIEIKSRALKDQVILKFTAGKEIRKIIYVPNRILNIVI